MIESGRRFGLSQEVLACLRILLQRLRQELESDFPVQRGVFRKEDAARAPFAERLKKLKVTVFYDRFEQVNLWGRDLAEHLGKVYSKNSHFVVMFASRQYAEKAWPSHERQFALSRHLSGESGRILPVRLDDTEIPGLPGTIAYSMVAPLPPRR